MAEEEVAVPPAPSSPPLHSDLKRKHGELGQLPIEAPRPEDEKSRDVSEDKEALDSSAIDGDSQEAKRVRVEDETPDEPVVVGQNGQNGFEEGKPDEDAKGDIDEGSGKSELPDETGAQPASEDAQPAIDGAQESRGNDVKVVSEDSGAADDKETSRNQLDLAGELELGKAEAPSKGEDDEAPSKGEDEEPKHDAEEPLYDGQTTSRKTEVPNDKVGVLIGKGGDTIRFLQQNSGAKIQIMRDADFDPRCTTRPVEIIGTLACISKAEKLIHAVIAEASVGGSPSLVARGHPSVQSVGVPDQLEMQVPNEKVGLIIGKGGETIKGLQTKTGARIQLIPQHLPEGDGSKERTVRVTGDRTQIEMARELIKEVMSQNVRQSSNSGGYNQQQSYRRGPSDRGHWGPRGPHPSQPPMPYDYHQRGPYPPQNMHYPPPSYGNYPPPQHMGPRSNYGGSGWEQRPPPPSSGGYDYYGGQRGHMSDHPPSGPVSGHPPPTSQSNYGYGQPHHGSDYGNQAPYSQPVPQQSYDNHAPPMHSHYGHAPSQPGYPPAQQQYNKQPSYPMQPPQQYSAGQQYGQGAAATQQQYPYQSTAPAQQGYPQQPYGAAAAATATATDGYNQAAAAAAAPPSGQPVPAYGQTAGQQPAQPGYPTQQTGYVQGTAAASYGSYPSSHGYPDQPAANATAGYGYQAQDPYSAQPAAGQQVYGQATATPAPAQPQPSYDQSGSYAAPAAAPGSAPAQPATYPQYDSTQMHAAPH